MTPEPELITESINLLKKCGYTVLTEEEAYQVDIDKFKWKLISLCLFAWAFALMVKLAI